MRTIPYVASRSSSTASSLAGAEKAGQPQPESYFASEEKISASQAAQRYVPGSKTSSYSPVNGGSVPFSRSTWYCSGVSSARHSASVLSIFGITRERTLRAVTDEGAVLAKLVAWGESQPRVRAVILTSTRARPGAPVDALSDYDLILALADVEPFLTDDAWTHAYGRPLVRWGDESERLGVRTYFRGVVYEDGAKIDYSLWPQELLERVAAAPELPDQLDVGYRVLLDKDGRTAAWPPPTYRAHIPAPPTEGEYRALVEEFWWSATYAAKALWRGELFFAKFSLDYDMRLKPLRMFLEWRIELDHGWSLKPGAYGRGLERLLPPVLWAGLEATFVGADADENWEALFRMAELFRSVARDVGDALGYAYPQDVDDGVSEYLRDVRELPRVTSPSAPRR